jgi:NAD(P)-dependent dehydrogenase (short-subunit alcohol dehydrogenase family)
VNGVGRRLAVVTGCSTGIGRATVIALADAGYDVVATMRNPADGSELRDAGIRVESLDVTSDGSVEDLFDTVGAPDLLVNNAGIGFAGSCEDTSVAEVRRAMETNFYGMVRCCRAVLPAMRERRSGCIVTVTSGAAAYPMPLQSAYNASKWAAEGWTESLAYEMAPFGVKVAIVRPGLILTPMLRKEPSPVSANYRHQGTRVGTLWRQQIRWGTSADEAAAAIVRIIHAEGRQLRWLVGPDAEVLAAGHAAHGDAERSAMYATADDGEFWEQFADLYGAEVLPDSVRPTPSPPGAS